VSLRDGIWISKDLKGATHYFKLSSDQGNADGQFWHGVCLHGTGIPKDLKGAWNYFKLSADQRNADGHFPYGQYLLDGKGISIDLSGACFFSTLCLSRKC
jgi:TPR repeat protein